MCKSQPLLPKSSFRPSRHSSLVRDPPRLSLRWRHRTSRGPGVGNEKIDMFPRFPGTKIRCCREVCVYVFVMCGYTFRYYEPTKGLLQ